VAALAAALSIAGVIAVTLWQLHLNLLFQNTTTTGGDTGAHVMMPQYLETLLAHGHLTGWSPQWYDGYPIYTFYFVLPDLLVALGAKVIAYNVAFKWGTVLGSVALPVAIWACARWFGLRRPLPGVLAAAALPFLFDYTYTIYGGNLFSTLAGEYAYSLSLTLALAFLGLFASVLRTGRRRGWAAVLLAACVLSHIVPALFALVGAAVLTGFELLPARWVPDDDRLWGVPAGPVVPLPRRRVLWLAGSTVAVGLLLSGWWLVPFGLRGAYSTSMGYTNLTDFATLLLPRADWWALVIAAIGVVLAVALRSRFALLFAVLGGLSALALVVDPQGKLYNVRLLPLWFACVYLLAAWVLGVVVVVGARWSGREPLGWWSRRSPAVPELGPSTVPEPPEAPRPAFVLPGGGSAGVARPPGTSAAWPLAAGPAEATVALPPAGANRPAGVGGAPDPSPPSATIRPPSPSASATAWFGAPVVPSTGSEPPSAPDVVADPGASDGPGGRRGPAPRWEDPPGTRRRRTPGAVVGPLVAIAAACLVVVPPFIPGLVSAHVLPVTPGANQVTNWSRYNYVGYEGQPSYPEYQSVMTMMRQVGARYGCGRAMWEYNADLGRFGTPEALMLLPYWTDGCIDSMEGLLFESSTTTPYHFLNQAELSVGPSNPMVGLPYGPVDVPLGIEHLQLLGTRYFMATSPSVQQAAEADPSLRLVASIGPFSGSNNGTPIETTWDVFLVAGSQLVQPLTHLPDVLRGVGPAQPSWLPPSVAWYDDPARWDVELAQSGPANWPRVAAGQARSPAVAVPSTTVSDIHQSDQSISFRVSRVGTPVLVKVSYFPNWQAHGANGPWRVTPNLMVVVPTSHDVTVVYGTTPANEAGLACTIAGLLALVLLAAGWLWRRSRRPYVPRPRSTDG
jgi:hypothetical protein